MTKPELIAEFHKQHREFSEYINSLSDDDFVQRRADKWSPGQQLLHVYMTLVPFPKVLPAKAYIQEKFGTINRALWDYDTVIKNYKNTSLKAPEQYLPEAVTLQQRASITQELDQILAVIEKDLDKYSETELDTLVLPHPLLGKLTLREMFYLMSYHAAHHLQQTQRNLNLA